MRLRAVWTSAANEADRWYRWVLEAAKRFMVEWHKGEEDMSRKRHAPVEGGAQANGEGGGNSRRETAVGESKKETADRVVIHQADYSSSA